MCVCVCVWVVGYGGGLHVCRVIIILLLLHLHLLLYSLASVLPRLRFVSLRDLLTASLHFCLCEDTRERQKARTSAGGEDVSAEMGGGAWGNEPHDVSERPLKGYKYNHTSTFSQSSLSPSLSGLKRDFATLSKAK